MNKGNARAEANVLKSGKRHSALVGLTGNMLGNNVAAESPKVAIVDDDQSIREAIKTLLDSLGLCVDDFSSAEDFLKSGQSEVCDCLILDVRMPEVGGLELQRRLAADKIRIPIVFITAHYSEEDRAKAIEGGAIAFLNKPFTEHELLAAIGLSLASQKHVTDRNDENSGWIRFDE